MAISWLSRVAEELRFMQIAGCKMKLAKARAQAESITVPTAFLTGTQIIDDTLFKHLVCRLLGLGSQLHDQEKINRPKSAPIRM